MAGGRGSRLQMGEKGLVRLCDRPLIDYAITALEEAGVEQVVVTTPSTPYTANYCRVRGIDQVCTEGKGYVEDIIEAVSILNEIGPILIVCADIPGLTSDHLKYIFSSYNTGGKPACSVWIPAHLFEKQGCITQFTQEISGIQAAPAGLNILLGEAIEKEQEEHCILIEDPALTYNVNTRSELKAAEEFFSHMYNY
jgi:adenosylcobinamide-phosphate guanylyltransferase